jgi:hypothetical protein
MGLALGSHLGEPFRIDGFAQADATPSLDISGYIEQIQLTFDAHERQIAHWQSYLALAGTDYWKTGARWEVETEALNKVLYLVHNMRAPNYELILKSNNEIVIRQTVGDRSASVERAPAAVHTETARATAEWVH